VTALSENGQDWAVTVCSADVTVKGRNSFKSTDLASTKVLGDTVKKVQSRERWVLLNITKKEVGMVGRLVQRGRLAPFTIYLRDELPTVKSL
jgi:hypothetical protein